jgi:hypothetical protein
MISGYILFLFRGGRDVKSSAFGNDSITSNENAVMFTRESQPAFDNLRQMLNDRIEYYRNPQPIQSQSGQSPLDELKKLAELRDSGVITSEEFDREKTRFLAKL